jgi:electron transfer flavoprotein beta subunit
MKILVCISNVPDTTTKIKLTADSVAIDYNGVQWIINPWDELALTRALELMESSNGLIEKVDVVGVGDASSEPTLRKALAIGANEAFRIDAIPTDSYSTASEIAAFAFEKKYDLILTGIESSDYNGSAVGAMLAELLEYDSLSGVSGLDLNDGSLIVKRELDGGFQQIKCDLPAVLIVQKGIALDPRIPSMRGIMLSRSKPFQIIASCKANSVIHNLKYQLPPAKSACKMIAEDQAAEVIGLLINEAKVL